MRFFWLCVYGIILIIAGTLVVHADMASPSYKAEMHGESAGGGLLIASTNYKVEDGVLEWTASEALISGNYQLEGKLGISGTLPLPLFVSSNPGMNARFFYDQSAAYTLQAISPDGQALQYQAKQDSAVKAGFQTSSTLSWLLGVSDKGRRQIEILIKNANGTVAHLQSAFIFRRPVK